MKIYLTGGNGKLGQEVLKLIPNAIPVLRKPLGLKNEKIVDFTDLSDLKKKLADCEILIHLAGSMKFHDKKNLYEGNVLLTRNLLITIPKNAKVIFASSISIYGKNISGKIDEKAKPNPDSDYARTKYEAEEMVMKRQNSIVLRIGPIYGPQYEIYLKFLKLIKNGRMVIFGNGKNFVTFVHVQDVSKAIKNAINAKPGVYIITGKSETQEKIYEIAAAEFSVAPPKIKIPFALALFICTLAEKIFSFAGKKLFITSEHINILGKNRVFDCSKAEKELKFRPRQIERGIKEMLSIQRW